MEVSAAYAPPGTPCGFFAADPGQAVPRAHGKGAARPGTAPLPLKRGLSRYSLGRVVCSARVSQMEVSVLSIEPSAMARAVASSVVTVCLIR